MAKSGRKYIRSYCRTCDPKIRKEWRQANPAKARAQNRESKLRVWYGLSVSEFESMVQSQNGLCSICKNPPCKLGICVDHDHATGMIRALLCHRCNIMLGRMNDDPVLLRRMADYIEFHRDLVS